MSGLVWAIIWTALYFYSMVSVFVDRGLKMKIEALVCSLTSGLFSLGISNSLDKTYYWFGFIPLLGTVVVPPATALAVKKFRRRR